MKKIAIAGIGGIGGFIGAPLAKNYHNSEQVQVIFICRNETKDTIIEKGLTLESAQGKETVQPHLTSDDPETIGHPDVLILACKSYSLESMIKAYKSCIGEDTVIITLQNVVNGKEIIRKHTDQGQVIEGCIYVASNVKKPGHIQHVGGPGKIFIGGAPAGEYQWLTELLTEGGLDVTFEENIQSVLWKKYLFVAPVAAITTAYDITFGQLLEDDHLMNVLEKMMLEVQSLAAQKGVKLTGEDILNSKSMLTKFPYAAKSSLQLDFEGGHATEKKFLVDYIIEQSNRYGLKMPFYSEVNKKILSLA
ncbi:2-dehydropantoate 2-reductase [Fulvivirga kasyanovii]|uniref:2-dehydropantoate 2-reductase n=1 Tax=Fulvivirga kasyanovii TaxID=396812 RepID=A0ABW9RTG3_9BACT|nr:2-dehydropantoate 2-reductase [Fulvivirga kasyanovii]MTI27474.1 2-dehydropantoate 2-reductase [Fulvivirga kasyanovii]